MRLDFERGRPPVDLPDDYRDEITNPYVRQAWRAAIWRLVIVFSLSFWALFALVIFLVMR